MRLGRQARLRSRLAGPKFWRQLLPLMRPAPDASTSCDFVVALTRSPGGIPVRSV